MFPHRLLIKLTLASGRASLSSNGSLTLSITSGLPLFIIPDLRTCSTIISPNKLYIEVIISPPELGCSHLILRPTSKHLFISWSSAILLWTNLRTRGIVSKTYVPPIVRDPLVKSISAASVSSKPFALDMTTTTTTTATATSATVQTPQLSSSSFKTFDTPGTTETCSVLDYSAPVGEVSTDDIKDVDSNGDDDLLICHCKAHFPNVRQKHQRISSLAGNSNSDTPELQDSSAFKLGDGWRNIVAVLDKSGLLQILDEDNGNVLQTVDIRKILASRIRQIHYSLFEDYGVIYIEAIEGLVEDNLMFSSVAGPRTIYLKFSTDQQYEDWFSALRAFTRKRMFAPTTGNIMKGVRVVRKIGIRVIEGKTDDNAKPRSTSSGSSHTQSDLKNSEWPSNSSFLDSYVEIEFEDQVWARTFVNWGKKTPFWREDFEFGDFPVAAPTIRLVIKRRLGSRVSPSIDPVIGYVKLTESDLTNSNDKETWAPVIRGDPNTEDSLEEGKHTTIGKSESESSLLLSNGSNEPSPSGLYLGLKIRYEEIPVLAAEHYQGLETLLSDLTNRSTIYISDALNNTAGVSALCLRFFLTKSMGIDWISSLIDYEVAKIKLQVQEQTDAGNIEFRKNIENTLFRGNTLLTKSMEGYMKIVGQKYLNEVIGTFVRKLVENRAFLEIDPDRIPSTPQAINNKGKSPEAFVEENQRKLKQYMQFLWALITSSVKEMPFSFKIIFRKLRLAICEQLFDTTAHEEEKRSIVFNAVSGFLFLRFFCPAILNPKLFDLIRTMPSPQVQRSLTLVTKMTQGFANRVKFGYKEPWMIPLNEFLEEYESELVHLFDQVTLTELDQAELESKGVTVELTGELNFDDFEDRPVKESPVTSAMGDELSNPYLLDKYESLGSLVEFWHSKKPKKLPSSEKTSVFKVINELNHLHALKGTLMDQLDKAEILSEENIDGMIQATCLRFIPEKAQVCLANTKFAQNTITSQVVSLPGKTIGRDDSTDSFLNVSEADRSLGSTNDSPFRRHENGLSTKQLGANKADFGETGTISRRKKWSTKFLGRGKVVG